MLLAIDIGNSLIKFGVFDRAKLVSRLFIPTVREYSPQELYELTKANLENKISAIILSSVVTELRDSFQEFSENYFKIKPVFVSNNFASGLTINYNPPANLGVDRLINAFAASGKYGKPCIVCSFGTATTIDVVSEDNKFIGGIIAPGMNTLAEALHLKTSKLPHVEIKKPDLVIGNSTVSSIQSGIFYGYIGLVEGILERMFVELKEKPCVIATGGFAKLIAENCSLIETVDENLTLEGLRMVYEKI
jgi:type III pantothenate kinase